MILSRRNIDIAIANAGLASYAELARRMGCKPQSLSIILARGSCRPATADKIAAALGVPLESLLEGGSVR